MEANDMNGEVATCGMNCSYCYAHLRERKPCPGCRRSDAGKPEHCRHCKMKECAQERRVEFCADCSDYPCLLIKRLDRSYRTRYNESLINNMKLISEKGMEHYLVHERKRLSCPECGGVLNLHHKMCAACGKTFEVPEQEGF